jgi:hypothetical protein
MADPPLRNGIQILPMSELEVTVSSFGDMGLESGKSILKFL